MSAPFGFGGAEDASIVLRALRGEGLSSLPVEDDEEGPTTQALRAAAAGVPAPAVPDPVEQQAQALGLGPAPAPPAAPAPVLAPAPGMPDEDDLDTPLIPEGLGAPDAPALGMAAPALEPPSAAPAPPPPVPEPAPAAPADDDDGIGLTPSTSVQILPADPGDVPPPVAPDAPTGAALPGLVNTGQDVSTTTSVSRQQAAPGEEALAQTRDQLLAEQESLEAQRTPGLQALAEQRAQLQAQQQEAIQEIQQEAQRARADAQARDAEDLERMRQLRSRDFWGDSTGNRVLAAIFVGLGQFAAGAGRRNTALEILDKRMSDWNRRRELEIASIARRVQQRGGGNVAAQRVMEEGLRLAKLSQQAELERLEAEAAAGLLKAGRSQTEIDQDLVINGIRQKRATLELDRRKELRQKIETAGRNAIKLVNNRLNEQGQRIGLISERTGKPPTDAESKNAGFGRRMIDALRQIEAMGRMPRRDIAEINKRLAAERNRLINSLVTAGQALGLGDGQISPAQLSQSVKSNLTEKGGILFDSFMDFALSQLRKESGAAISIEEANRMLDQVLPFVGETARQRRIRLERMRGLALDSADQSHIPSVLRARLNEPLSVGGARETGAAPSGASGVDLEGAQRWLQEQEALPANQRHKNFERMRERLRNL